MQFEQHRHDEGSGQQIIACNNAACSSISDDRALTGTDMDVLRRLQYTAFSLAEPGTHGEVVEVADRILRFERAWTSTGEC